jgi:spore germination protein YaaH
VPYWQITSNVGPFARPTILSQPAIPTTLRYVYFAINTNEFGLEKDDEGYEQLQTFLSKVPSGSKKYLAVSMLDLDTNYTILKDIDLQNTIIDQSIQLAHEHGFEGLVFDFEMPPLLTDKVPGQINDFMQLFGKRAREANIKSVVTTFGDVYYRQRPYDIRAIGSYVDELMIMAYDFHKASGEPGPNFPFEGQNTYSYDFQKMLTDYLAVVDTRKLTILYGMYGYDWTVDIEKRPIKNAQALTLQQIEQNYIRRCDEINCNQSRDPSTKETQLEFVDSDSQYHLIWYEDRESVARKTNYLNSQGVTSVGYWTYGYY